MGQVARSIENDDVTYRVEAHHPEGFMVHVVWNWSMVLVSVVSDTSSCFTQWGLERIS